MDYPLCPIYLRGDFSTLLCSLVFIFGETDVQNLFFFFVLPVEFKSLLIRLVRGRIQNLKNDY